MSRINGPGKLFWHRVRGHLSNQAGVIRSIVDWTVLLYIVLPALLLAIGWYSELLREGLPAIFGQLPLFVYSLVFILLIEWGCIQLFLYDGDVLFVRSNRVWLRGLMLRGGLYSMLMLVPVLSAAMLILAPILVQAVGLNELQLLALWLLSVTTGWTLLWVEHFAQIYLRRWRRWLLYPLIKLLIVAGYAAITTIWMERPAQLMLVSAVLGVLSFGMLWLRLRLKGTFLQTLQQDLKKRTRLTGLALTQAVEKPRKIRKKPALYRMTKRLYRVQTPERKLSAAVIRSWFRHEGNLRLYIQFIGASAASLWVSPLLIKCLVLLAVWLLLAYWLYCYFDSFLQQDLSVMLPWTSELTAQASILAVRGMLLPFVICMSLVFCLSAFPILWGWLLVIPLILLLHQGSGIAVSLLSLTIKSK